MFQGFFFSNQVIFILNYIAGVSMKFFHISDIHLGKKVNGYSMMDEQRYILGEILRMADEEKPDAVVIAGDIYDRTYPSPEAVALCDEFLFQLSSRSIAVLAISGNHDSAERHTSFACLRRTR